MQLKNAGDIKKINGKTVLLRVAYDVPLEEKRGKWVVSDNRRIIETLPTINYLLKHDCKIVILTWLKRPAGKVVGRYRLDPVAKSLSQLLKKPVKKLDDCIGPKVFSAIKAMKPGQILMLENVRFYHQEEENDKRFAKLLAHGSDLIVFDAFAQAHRIHASTVGITQVLPAYAGFLLENEIEELNKVIKQPKRPLLVILGGAKISDKIVVLQTLVKKADKILIGGGLANIFAKALNYSVGSSFVEDVFVDKAKRKKLNFLKLAKEIYSRYKDKLVLPVDFIATNKIDSHGLIEVIDINKQKIDRRWLFVDIGPETIANFLVYIKKAKTIFWNGPMGVFEIGKFAFGTKKIAEAVSRSLAVSVVGGGDTETIVKKYKLEGKFDHVSTGGGASLEYLANQDLPVLKYLIKK